MYKRTKKHLKTIRSNWVTKKTKIRRLDHKLTSHYPSFLRTFGALLSLSLCTFQVVSCINKFWAEPTGTSATIEQFRTYTIPTITICPPSIDYFYDFNNKFEIKCKDDETCNKLSPDRRQNYPFSRMNLSLEDLWDVWSDFTHNASVQCIGAVNKTECSPGKWYTVRSFDTIAGKCQVLNINLEWHFAGKSINWWFEIQNVSRIPGRSPKSFSLSVQSEKKLDRNFYPKTLIDNNVLTDIELSITQFRHLNSSKKPCGEAKARADCVNNCINSIFDHGNVDCKWPFVESILPHCDSLHQLDNLHKTIRKSIQERTTNCPCTRACNHTVYSLTRFVTRRTFDDSTALTLTAPSNSLQIVTEFQLYPFLTLVSDLGGNIGLFLGISLLSTFNALHLILPRIVRKTKQLREFLRNRY